jgi:hypothetical protein
MNKNEKITAASMITAFIILLLLHFYFQQTSGGQTSLEITSDVSLTLFSFLMFLMIYKNTELKRLDKEVWVIIVLAFFLYFTGYLIWDFYSYVLGGDPEFPSLADLSWSIFYLFIGYGGYRILKTLWISIKPLQIIVFAILSIAIYAGLLLLYDVTTYLSDASTIAIIVSLWYPFGDTIIIVAALALAYEIFFKELKTGLLLGVAGFLAMAIADIIWTTDSMRNIYYVGSLPDMLYLVSYFSLSLSFLITKSFVLFKINSKSGSKK